MSYLLKYKVFAVIVIGLALVSCSPDIGNYEYHNINEAEITLDSEYVALFGQPFIIKPEVNFTLDEGDSSRYQYRWYAYDESPTIDAGSINQEPIDTTKNLSIEHLSLLSGSYKGLYTIKDKVTGVKWSRTFKLLVESTISKGWLILNDVNGKARLDMIAYYSNQYHNIQDVLTYSNSPLKLKGKPIDLVASPYTLSLYGVYVTTTGNGTIRLNPNTFDWKETYRLSYDMLIDVPTNYAADFIQPLSVGGPIGVNLMYKEENVYSYFPLIGYKYGSLINVVSGVQFKAAPYIGAREEIAQPDILYDVTHKRFVIHPYATLLCTPLSGSLFDYNTGKDLVWMGQTYYNNGEVFAFLKDSSNDKFYLARMRASSSSSITQIFYGEIPTSVAIVMDRAKHFAVSPDFGYIFYSVGGKLYEYDFSLKTAKLMLNKTGQEITTLKFQHTSPVANKLVIATYDAGSGKGTFELYTVPPVNGDLVLYKTYQGFGKIVSVTYKEK